MSNSYYNGGSFPATGAPATSASMRAELSAITAGFDKLPVLSGNANKLVVVNSSASALEVTTALPPITIADSSLIIEDNGDSTRRFRFEANVITPGSTRVLTVPDADLTLVGTATTQTLTNKTLNLASNTLVATSAQLAAAVTDETGSGALVFGTNPTISGATLTGGSINNTPIGGSTPAAGAFTTLSTSSTVTFSANPTLSGGTANGVLYLNGSKVATSGSALSFNGTNFYTTANIYGGAGNANANIIASSNVANGGAGFSQFLLGNTSSDTRGYLSYSHAADAMLFGVVGTEQMRLTSTGLGIGTSSPGTKLDVQNGNTASALTSYFTTGPSDPNFRLGFENGSGTTVSSPQAALRFDYVGVDTLAKINFWRGNSSNCSAIAFNIGGAGGSTELMRLDSSGNLGIGTSSPGYKLHVSGSQVTSMTQSTASSDAAVRTKTTLGDFGTGTGIGTATNCWNVYDYAASAERMRLDSVGNLGLGVTPSAWASGWSVYQASRDAMFGGASGGVVYGFMSVNAYADGSSSPAVATWRYKLPNAASRYQQADGVHSWFTAPSGTAGNAISFTQAMTLDASGNLGVGTTSPQSKLHVAGEVAFWATGNDAFRAVPLAAGSGSKFLSTNSANNAYAPAIIDGSSVAFQTSSTERTRITSGGDLLVGTTDAAQTSGAGFKVGGAGGIGVGQVAIVDPDSTNTTITYRLYSTGASAYRFYVGLGGTVYATNTTISAISDQRFKENVRDLDVGLNAIMALKPRKFDWKAGKGKDIKNDRGFIAQEFEQVFPDLVDQWADPAPEGEDPYKSVRQDLIPVLVKAIQEQQALITDLRARVAALEAQP